jgi:hypothetical protein
MSINARAIADSYAELINRKAKYHRAEVTVSDYDNGTIFYLAIMGTNWFAKNLYSVGWLQKKPGTQGPQVKFITGRADGFGTNAGKVVTISNVADLDSWITIVVGLYDDF